MELSKAYSVLVMSIPDFIVATGSQILSFICLSLSHVSQGTRDEHDGRDSATLQSGARLVQRFRIGGEVPEKGNVHHITTEPCTTCPGYLSPLQAPTSGETRKPDENFNNPMECAPRQPWTAAVCALHRLRASDPKIRWHQSDNAVGCAADCLPGP